MLQLFYISTPGQKLVEHSVAFSARSDAEHMQIAIVLAHSSLNYGQATQVSRSDFISRELSQLHAIVRNENKKKD